MNGRRSQLAALILSFLAGGVFFAILTPVGEGPDEPAHLAYVRHLIERCELPSPPLRYDAENYEWHQQPLDYVMSAMLLRVLAPREVDLSFTPNPGFDFRRAGSRAFASASGGSINAVRALRVIRLGWGLISLYAAVAILSIVIPNRQVVWLAFPYLLAPQFLFISAVINNDAAVTAFSTLTLLLLARFVEAPDVRRGLLAGLCVLGALFSKASGVFLIVPGLIAAGTAWRQNRKPSMVLAASTIGAFAIWAAFNAHRFGSVIPPVPPAGSAASAMQLVSEPRWIGSLFRSFWAKFGWLNTPMPLPFYIWFALLSLFVVFGIVVLLRPGASAILFSALATNALLVTAFLLQVDLQPQGRYLFPSIGAIAIFGAAGLHVALQRANARLALVISIIAAIVAAAGVVTILLIY